MIVVDTNVLSYFFLSGEHTAPVAKVFEKDSHWIAPPLWASEFRSVLVLYIRKRILTLEEAAGLAGHVESFMKGNEYPVASGSVLALAKESGCSAYDCEFVALALAMDVPLVTTEKKLLNAFPATALSPGAFLA